MGFRHLRLALIILLSLGCYTFLAYTHQREQFYLLLASVSILFSAYFLLLREKLSFNTCLIIGVLFRSIWFISIPALSDDYFRFIWDGALLNNGINPFNVLPVEVETTFSNKEILLANMNSPNYYSVYPPFKQLLFSISVWLSPNSILGSIISMRIFIIAADVGIILILKKLLQGLKKSAQLGFLYFLNPLVIIELSGNLHFEGIALFFFLLSISLLLRYRNNFLAGFSWAIAVLTKLTPLIYLPALLRNMSVKALVKFGISFLITIGLSLLLFFTIEQFTHFGESIKLYFKTFEFNGSIYFLARSIGYWITGYNQIAVIGPLLSVLSTLIIFFLLLQKTKQGSSKWFQNLLFAITTYYLFASIVHPWYIINLIVLSCLTQFRFPLIWSGFVFLSYSAYQHAETQEHYWLIAIEYAVVYGTISMEIFFPTFFNQLLKKLRIAIFEV